MADDDNYAWLDEHSRDPRRDPAIDSTVPAVPSDLTPDAYAPLTPTEPESVPPAPAMPPLPNFGAAPTNVPPPPGPRPNDTIEPTMDSGFGTAAAGAGMPPRAPAPPPNAGLNFPSSSPVGPPPAPKRDLPLGTILKIVGALAVVGIIFFVGRGTTSAASLGEGDCFEIPDATFERVDNQDCDGPHEAEIYAEVTAATLSIAQDRCFEAFFALSEQAISTLPDDADLFWISDEDGGTDYLCGIESPSGALVGSVLGN